MEIDKNCDNSDIATFAKAWSFFNLLKGNFEKEVVELMSIINNPSYRSESVIMNDILKDSFVRKECLKLVSNGNSTLKDRIFLLYMCRINCENERELSYIYEEYFEYLDKKLNNIVEKMIKKNCHDLIHGIEIIPIIQVLEEKSEDLLFKMIVGLTFQNCEGWCFDNSLLWNKFISLGGKPCFDEFARQNICQRNFEIKRESFENFHYFTEKRICV